MFNKAASAIMAVTIMSGIALTGCGSTTGTSAGNSASNTTVSTSSNTSAGTNSNVASTSNQSAANSSSLDSSSSNPGSQAVSVKDGVAKLLTMATDLKTDISSGDAAKIKENGPKLEDIWSSFEDNVKPKYPDLYDQVEQYLDPTVAGSKAAQPDKQALLKLDDGLIQALTELSQKVQ